MSYFPPRRVGCALFLNDIGGNVVTEQGNQGLRPSGKTGFEE